MTIGGASVLASRRAPNSSRGSRGRSPHRICRSAGGRSQET
jgi:hypothetical protein